MTDPTKRPDMHAMGGDVQEKPKFSHLEEMIKKHKKAGSELQASKDPMKFIKDSKNMSIKNKKGVAFKDGGSVKKK
jgi:hypothetical protein